MAFLKVKNRAISTLASGISDSDLSLTVATGEGALFPTAGDFHLTCEDEIVKCTSRTGDVLTVTRAQEGTAAAAHASGKAVELRITAGVIENIEDELTTQKSSFHAYRSDSQVIPGSTWVKLDYHLEYHDIRGEYNNNVVTGTADATSANQLKDTGAFTEAESYYTCMTCWNTTDNTYALVTGKTDNDTLTLSADIMADGENYRLYAARFVATEAGIYLFTAVGAIKTLDDGDLFSLLFYKNGAQARRITWIYGAAAGTIMACGSAIIKLAASDYIEVWVAHGNAAVKDTSDDALNMQFEGIKVA